jgi:hypothetical protein
MLNSGRFVVSAEWSLEHGGLVPLTAEVRPDNVNHGAEGRLSE